MARYCWMRFSIPMNEANIAEMIATPDWVQFALDREMVEEPGGEFCYDSPGKHLLSAVL